MRTFKDDYSFGVSEEDKILQKINDYFKDNIVKSKSSKSIYDYKGGANYYEVKSRKNTYDAYPTTLIGANKVFTNNQVFIFNFTDGIYYIKYDEDLFKTFDKKLFKRNTRSDYIDKESYYYFIPCNKLIKI
jgi:hypothetical protein